MTVLGGEIILASDINAIDTATRERIATTILTADTATWDDTPEVSVTTVTATLVDGQRYKVWFHGRVSSGTAASVAGLRIREDTGIAGTQLNFGNYSIPTTTGNGFTCYLYAEYTAAASGSKTFSLTGQCTAGAVHVQLVRASANAPAVFAIEKVVS